MTGSPRPRIAVLDYGIGNLHSAEKALRYVGADAELTADPDRIERADALVLPGVGAFGRCMQELEGHGLHTLARDAIARGRLFLGICIGMQMLFERSEEAPDVAGLGVLDGTVRRLRGPVSVPHMGWNRVEARPGSELFAGIAEPHWLYFVHSYAAEPDDERDVAAWCEHGGRVVAAVERGPLWATQFHPEKSGDAGLAVLANFVRAATRVRAGAPDAVTG